MPDAQPKHVFVSIGGRYTSDQESFVEKLLETLLALGATPHVMNLTDYPPGNPLKGILRVMRNCHGVIVVAFERKYFETGLENRNSPAKTKSLKDVRLPTPFNQIEAAIAFTFGLPILVFREPGIFSEGLLEEKFDWYIHDIEVRPESLSDRGLRARLQSWYESLTTTSRSETPTIINASGTPTVIDAEAIKKMTLFDLYNRFSVGLIIAIAVAISAAFSGGYTVNKLLQDRIQQHPP